ncbi:class E sortase [Leucobacter sp. GX24907]
MSSSPAAGARHRRRRKRRAPLSPLTVIGEILLLGGLGVFGYIVWQPWHTGVTVTAQQQEISNEISAGWDDNTSEGSTDGVPVAECPEGQETCAILHIPAFGLDFAAPVVDGTDWNTVLNSPDMGSGHYPATQTPGEVGGNFAVAAHRNGPVIAPFREVMNLRVGDPMFAETPDGWYLYRFRSIEYVTPDQSEVLNPFPHLEGEPGEDQILTLTTCHPKNWGTDERAIAYGVLEDFQPRSDGVPEELIELRKGGDQT